MYNALKTHFNFVVAVPLIVITLAVWPQYKVYQQKLTGEAALKRAEQERLILVEQANAELAASEARAKAIAIMGEAAQNYPEYREQEFIGAFAEAIQNGAIDQIYYVPTERNIPIVRTQ